MLLMNAPNEWGQVLPWGVNSRSDPIRLDPLPVELRLSAGSVHLQCALLADGVRPLEDPVLPRSEATKDARQHRLGAGEAQARFHAGKGVGREARALLDGEADLLVPVDVVGR